MIQKQTFKGGIFAPNSFVLHKITGKFKGKCSAWYFADGTIFDCELIRRDGQIRMVRPGSPMFRHCQAIGKNWINTL